MLILAGFSFLFLQSCSEDGIKGDSDAEKSAKKLCELLQNEAFGFPIDEWSYLNPSLIQDGNRARELVELGEHSVSLLKPLLSDTTKVVIAGSEYSTLAEAYKLRVCDFAFRYWCQIHEIDYQFYETPAQRDDEITRVKGETASPQKLN